MTGLPTVAGTPPRVVLATGNAKKLTELQRLVAEAGAEIEILGLNELAENGQSYPAPAETERTFEGNALLKARTCLARTGLASLADDSGIAVDELNQMPGVRSARWAGPECDDQANNALLLRQLYDVADDRRGAQFVCAVALVLADGTEFVRRGVMAGRLLRAARGSGGFGYDPLFVAEGQSRSNGELSAAEKDAISHRGRAVRAMVPVLVEQLTAAAGKLTDAKGPGNR